MKFVFFAKQKLLGRLGAWPLDPPVMPIMCGTAHNATLCQLVDSAFSHSDVTTSTTPVLAKPLLMMLFHRFSVTLFINFIFIAFVAADTVFRIFYFVIIAGCVDRMIHEFRLYLIYSRHSRLMLKKLTRSTDVKPKPTPITSESYLVQLLHTSFCKLMFSLFWCLLHLARVVRRMLWLS